MQRSWRTGREVEPPCPFFSVRCTKGRRLFPLNASQIGADLGDGLPEKLFHLVLGRSDDFHSRHAGQFPSHQLRFGQLLAGPPFLPDGEVVEAFALVGVRAARHAACCPGCAPTTPHASTARRRRPAGHRSAIPRLAPAPPAQCRCRPGRTRRPRHRRGRSVRCGRCRRCPPSPRTPSPCAVRPSPLVGTV